MSDKKVAGIWMDSENAIVIKNHDTENTTEFFVCDPVKREVQHGNSSEKNANNVEQTNIAKYFKDLETMITNTKDLYLTGTGTIQEQFKNHLAETAQFKNVKVTLDTDQKMSEEHFLEKVKTHFVA